MYFLLYWIQTLRKAKPVGPERVADPALACSRWWERRGLPWASPSMSRQAFCPWGPVDEWGNSLGAFRGPSGSYNPNVSPYLAELEWTSPSKVLLGVCGSNHCADHSTHTEKATESNNNATQHFPLPWKTVWQNSLLFTLNDEIFRQLHISSRSLKELHDIGINMELMLPNIF